MFAKMKKALNYFGNILVILSIIFLFDKLKNNFNQIPDILWGFQAALILIVAVLFSAFAVAINSYVWFLILRNGNNPITLREAYIIVGQSQMGKYLPGNVFQYFGRLALGRKYGLSTKAIVLSTGLEIIIAVISGVFVGFGGLLLDKKILEQLPFSHFSMHLIFIAFACFILGVFIIANKQTRNWIFEHRSYLRLDRLAICIMLYCSVYCFFGIITPLILNFTWGVSTEVHWYQFAWAFALAWTLGFILPGAPGGLGIRELVLVSLFARDLGDGIAVGVFFILRVVTTSGDFVAFLLASWLAIITPVPKTGKTATVE